jgi:phospholipid/cholesterol/gamma-HCH transport system permease protein
MRGGGRDSSRHPERSDAGVDALGVGGAGGSADERGAGRWTFHVERPASEIARVELTGAWRKENWLPDPSDVWREIQLGPAVHRLTFDTSHVTDWDSGLVTFARGVLEEAKTRGIESDRAGLPDGAQRLLHLAEAVPERQTGRARSQPPWLARIGARATEAWIGIVAGLTLSARASLPSARCCAAGRDSEWSICSRSSTTAVPVRSASSPSSASGSA